MKKSLQCNESFVRPFKLIIIIEFTIFRYKNLRAVDLDRTESVVSIKDDVIYFSTKWASKNIQIELLSDYKLPLRQVSYVRADSAQLHIAKKGRNFFVRCKEFVFTDYQLGYWFFTLLKHENGHENVYNISPDPWLHRQVRQIMSHIEESCNNDQQPRGFNNDWCETVNNYVRRLKIPRAFFFGVNYDFNDQHVIDKIKSLFLEHGVYPTSSVCIRKIHDVLCSYIEEDDPFDRSNNIEAAVGVFLNHFINFQQRELVQLHISRFFKLTWS